MATALRDYRALSMSEEFHVNVGRVFVFLIGIPSIQNDQLSREQHRHSVQPNVDGN